MSSVFCMTAGNQRLMGVDSIEAELQILFIWYSTRCRAWYKTVCAVAREHRVGGDGMTGSFALEC